MLCWAGADGGVSSMSRPEDMYCSMLDDLPQGPEGVFETFRTTLRGDVGMKWNLLGCVSTSLLIGASAFGDSVAVSVTDLGCGPQNCGPDTHADIIRHDASTGEITLHYMTQNGLDLIESDFTLDGLTIEGDGGENYSAGIINFNNNDTNGTGASARYEVNGKISDLVLSNPGSGYTRNLTGKSEYGAQVINLRAIILNENGTLTDGVQATATAYVAPFPGLPSTDGALLPEVPAANNNRSWFTAFRIEDGGIGGPPNSTLKMKMPFIDALTSPDMGDILAWTDEFGTIYKFVRSDDGPNNAAGVKWLHELPVSIDNNEVNDTSVYVFNQKNTNGFGDEWQEALGYQQPIPVFTDNIEGLNQSVEFVQPPTIRFYRGGEIMHVALDDENEITNTGFNADPVFTQRNLDFNGVGGVGDEDDLALLAAFDSTDGSVFAPNHNSSSASLKVSWSRRGAVSEIVDFNPGSGYDAVPAITLSDPDGLGSGASVSLQSTEAFTGGPRKMVYADTKESILLPGSGWEAMPGDFNGDGSPDLFWWSPNLGASSIWILENGHIQTTANMPVVDGTIKPIIADLDDDGISEIFWWDSLTGITGVWGITPGSGDWVTFSEASLPVTDVGWELVARTERYGRDAILWQNRNDGTTGTWTMSRQAPNVLEVAADFTWATGELLVPGPNWEIIGTGDLNGDGLKGDLLWHSNDEWDRIAFWMIGTSNFLEGDYLSYNGQEVTIDAPLGGIGTYTTDRHLNLIWNDGGQVINWEMARPGQSSFNQASSQVQNAAADAEVDITAMEADRRDDEEGLESNKDDEAAVDGGNSNATEFSAAEDVPSTPVLGPISYRLAGAWIMDEDGLLSPTGFDFFEGYPANLGENANDNSTSSGGGASSGGSDSSGDDKGSSTPSAPEDPPLVPDPDSGITVPGGIDECDYVCSLDKNDPSGWPPEFQNAPPEIIQSIWDVLIDGLVDLYGCDPCPDLNPLGACCSEEGDFCTDSTEAECIFPGLNWLGAGTTCEDDCD